MYSELVSFSKFLCFLSFKGDFFSLQIPHIFRLYKSKFLLENLYFFFCNVDTTSLQNVRVFPLCKGNFPDLPIRGSSKEEGCRKVNNSSPSRKACLVLRGRFHEIKCFLARFWMCAAVSLGRTLRFYF